MYGELLRYGVIRVFVGIELGFVDSKNCQEIVSIPDFVRIGKEDECVGVSVFRVVFDKNGH